jgi:hypothetical protein
MGLLDKATRDKGRGLDAKGGMPARRFPLDHKDLETLITEISTLAGTVDFPLEAYLRISETIPFDVFALVLHREGKAVTLGSRGARKGALFLPPGRLADLVQLGGTAPIQSASPGKGDKAHEGWLQNGKTGTFQLLDARDSLQGSWHIALSLFDGLDDLLRGDMKRLFASVRPDASQFAALRSPGEDAFRKLATIAAGKKTPVLGFRVSAQALEGCKSTMEVSEAGAGFALAAALRRALGGDALVTATASRLSAFVLPNLPTDPELYLAQLRLSIRRALSSLPEISGAPFEAFSFDKRDTLGKDLERFARG